MNYLSVLVLSRVISKVLLFALSVLSLLTNSQYGPTCMQNSLTEPVLTKCPHAFNSPTENNTYCFNF